MRNSKLAIAIIVFAALVGALLLARRTPLTYDVAPAAAAEPAKASPYLFIWIGDGERKASDFLAVIDADPASPAYGHVVAGVAADAVGTMPHHTEYEMPRGGVLLASGWAAGRVFAFDVRQPRAPKLSATFSDVGEYSYPHSFARLPNGNVLAVFQSPKGRYTPGGGLVELDERGRHIRSTPAAAPKVTASEIWPYSLEIDAPRDRVITVNTPMGMPDWAKLPVGSWEKKRIGDTETRTVQLWQLSDLKLLTTLSLPESGNGNHHVWPAEPRVLPDGSLYVNTFSCGLYHVTGHDTAAPQVKFVHAFPGGDSYHTICSVPVIIGKYWIQSVAALPGLIVLDISDPAKPKEVSRLVLDKKFTMAHWLAADRKGSRVVVTGSEQNYVLMVNVDPQSGKLSLDERFKDEITGEVGLNLTRARWPHGGGGKADVHGAVFGPR
jgi:56kDa selenium binding protein (SBP56)